MPSTRNALKKLLVAVEQQIADAEAHIMKTTSDEERTTLVDKLADLHIRQNDLKAVLVGDDSAH